MPEGRPEVAATPQHAGSLPAPTADRPAATTPAPGPRPAGTPPEVAPTRAAEAEARRAAWRLVPAPLAVAKAISLLIALATAWATRPESVSLWSAVRTVFVHWDAIHYLDIAQHGYADHLDFHQAFFPGFPLVIAALTVVVRSDFVAALLFNVAAEAVALYCIGRLVMGERDLDAARFAVWCVALGPMAFFLSAVYPESMLIAAAAAALYQSRRGHHVTAAAAAAIACSARLFGLALIPVLLFEYLRQNRWRPGPAVIAIAAAPLPVLLFAIFLRVHAGDALAFIHAQSLPAFNHHLDWPWQGFSVTWGTVAGSDGEVQSVFVREVGFAFMGLAACVAAWLWPRFPRMLALYCTLIWLMATSLSFWRSVPRYDLALFPVVIIMADLTRRRPGVRAGVLGASAVVLGWGAWTFSRNHWLG